MNLKLQIIIAVIILIGFFLLTNLIRKNNLDLKYALSWILLGAAILILDLFPGITSLLARLLGIEVPVNMLFFSGILLFSAGNLLPDYGCLQTFPENHKAYPGSGASQPETAGIDTSGKR